MACTFVYCAPKVVYIYVSDDVYHALEVTRKGCLPGILNFCLSETYRSWNIFAIIWLD